MTRALVAADREVEARNAPYRMTEPIVLRMGNTLQGAIRPREFWARFIDLGTGRYGPRPRPFITPKKGKALVVPGSDTGYRAAVRGIRPRRIIERAKQSAGPRVEAIFAGGRERAADALLARMKIGR